MSAATPRDIATFLHYTYERLAPSFGYETREASRTWDADSPNGQLMIAVAGELVKRWRVDLPPAPPEQFQFLGSLLGGACTLGQFLADGTFQVDQEVSELERYAEQSWQSQTRAMARLILVIAQERVALAAADRLAHGYVFSPEHAQYWEAREITGRCSVCNGEGHSSDPET